MTTRTEVIRRLRNCSTDSDIIEELMEIVKDLAEDLSDVTKMAETTAQYVDETIESGTLTGEEVG